MVEPLKDHSVASIVEKNEANCWGCGLNLLLPSYAPVFKCGWCGAITNQNVTKPGSHYRWWRRLRDRCFVCTLLVFMLFVICGGVWAAYPVVFSLGYAFAVIHSIISIAFSISTLSTFCISAFRCAGPPPIVLWGSYPVVGKGDLENYSFCHYCSKPKSPRTHHCRSCGTCILDMDHHCPFIGNCVGAANHRYFIAFLISAIISTIYVTIMSTYVGSYVWPPLMYRSVGRINGFGSALALLSVVKEVIIGMFNSAVLVSVRGLVLVYLLVSSVSVEVGLSVLLWQQLSYIYEGQTYLGHLSSRGGDGSNGKGCENIHRFFGCPYSIFRYFPSMRNNAWKRHKK